MTSMIPCPRRSKTCSGDKSPLKPHPVVRRRSVGRGHRFVIQAQIHAELGAVVYQVIEEHLAVGQEARAAEDGLVAETQVPRLRPGFIVRVLESGANLGSTFIESLDQLCRGFKRHWGHLGLPKIQFRGGEEYEAEANRLRHVRRQFT